MDEREIVFALREGRHTIGTSGAADVVLRTPGVSRRHAVLDVRQDALLVEDLGSTNGTFVDGTLVQGGRLVRMGAEIRVGPVRLHVEPVSEEDHLAIVLDPVQRGEAGDEWLPTSRLATPDAGRSHARLGQGGAPPADLWLLCIEGFVERLHHVVRGGDLAPALSFLGTTLAAEGCCVVQWTESGDPLVLGAWGALHESPPHAAARRLADGTHGCGAALFEREPKLGVAALTRTDGSTLGLMVWGAYEHRSSSARMLQVLIRMIDHARPGALDHGGAPAASAKPHPELVFPAGYRPGTSPAMTALYAQMRALLRGDLPVLINGETGVGKEMIARILHESSERSQRPFVAVNCAAIPAELLESEMFGIEQGVATGVKARPGKFRLAEGGTLFLDEIGEMAPSLQAKLLRVLQQKEIQPLGGQPRAIDVRVIAATNVDLTRHVAAGALRADLYYRLAGCVLDVPPLRACAEDIPALVEYFLRRFASDVGVRIRGLTVGALRALTSYPWTGNIRELEHLIRRIVYMSTDGEVIDIGRLPRGWLEPRAHGDRVSRLLEGLECLELGPLVDAVEEHLIREALRRAGGKKVEARRLLGLSRNGLDSKMKRLGIEASSD
jgi:DNA-binding NtrC family response regulator